MNFKWVLIALVACVMAIGLLGLRPVPSPIAKNTVSVSALVEGLEGTDSYDIFLDVKGFEKERFYINRGAERGIDVDALEAYLVGKTAELTYVQHRSLFDPSGRVHHLVRVSCGDSLIFAQ